MTLTSRECDRCGSTYERKTSEVGRFCSHACYAAAKRRDAVAACLQCKSEFTHKIRSPRKYCSHSCAAAALRRPTTRNCDQCGTEYTRTPTASGKYCSTECSKAGRRKTNPAVRRMRYAPGHPLVLDSPYVPEHRAVLFEAIGPGTHPCNGCGDPVTWTPGGRTAPGVLLVDHLDRDPMNNALENLAPSCARCNVLNADRTVGGEEDFRTLRKGTRLRGLPRNCEYCGNGFVTWSKNPGEGKGRFCSRSCARHAQRTASSVSRAEV